MKLAVIRIRGRRKLNPKIKKTLDLMQLGKPHSCVVILATPQSKGMLNVVKDYVTFGEIDEKVFYELVYRRGERGAKLLRTLHKEDELKNLAKQIFTGKKLEELECNSVFRLHPPSKGFKNIKLPYPRGDLGKRSDISSLIRRMI